ncbi:uncharacterized protein LOC110200858 [Phascolarctos cinereus]|uniref:Vegetative cell wall protein gp1-like n=1 Tax=Phascolarctos cinereus TaxID=38626 RepID=A0A6P5JCA2_PHACI|nr:vegetative cell wall protein gp1-like [Phascolarctos cinereus]
MALSSSCPSPPPTAVTPLPWAPRRAPPPPLPPRLSRAGQPSSGACFPLPPASALGAHIVTVEAAAAPRDTPCVPGRTTGHPAPFRLQPPDPESSLWPGPRSRRTFLGASPPWPRPREEPPPAPSPSGGPRTRTPAIGARGCPSSSLYRCQRADVPRPPRLHQVHSEPPACRPSL